MTITVPAICKGDVLQLEERLPVPSDTRVFVTLTTGEDDEAWSDAELRSFEAMAYGPDEPDYGTIEPLQ